MAPLTPAQIVIELDRYIIGQERAKRAVAIALRNRWRRQKLPPELRDEVAPKNIIMIGPTGVGKTEIARRLAKLAQAPFLKVEASKYTEVGYVGRDVESMIRDLTELAVTMVRAEVTETVREKAEQLAEDHLLDLLLPRTRGREPFSSETLEEVTPDASRQATRDKLRQQLHAGLPPVDHPVQQPIELVIGEAGLALVGLAGPEIGRGGLADHHLGDADRGGHLAELALVEVADRVEGAGRVAEQGRVADERLGLVARPDDESAPGDGAVVEDAHPHPGREVAAPDRRRVRIESEIAVHHRADIDELARAAEVGDDPLGVGLRGR